jgi:hypothetical protein
VDSFRNISNTSVDDLDSMSLGNILDGNFPSIQSIQSENDLPPGSITVAELMPPPERINGARVHRKFGGVRYK